MPFLRRQKRVASVLLVLLLGVGTWLWLDKNHSTTHTPVSTPGADSPSVASTTQPQAISPPATPAPASVATPPAAQPIRPRLLVNKEIQNISTHSAVPDRWTAGQPLAESAAPAPDPSLRQRIRIVRTDFKYPLIRLEETFRRDDQTGADILIQQTAMVADHMLVKPAAGVDEGVFLAAVTAGGGTVRSIKPAAKIYLITLAAPLDINGLPQAIDALKAVSDVIRIAEPDFIVHAISTPNDSSFPQLYGLHNTGQTGGTADADIDAPEAWEITTGSRAVRVGVIDTGIDYTHPDLAANMWINPAEIAGNGVDDDGNGYVDDVRGWDSVSYTHLTLPTTERV